MSISTMQKDCSIGLLLVISPYPTVVMVVTMKYKHARYCSCTDASMRLQLYTQVSSLNYWILAIKYQRHERLWQSSTNTNKKSMSLYTSKLLVFDTLRLRRVLALTALSTRMNLELRVSYLVVFTIWQMRGSLAILPNLLEALLKNRERGITDTTSSMNHDFKYPQAIYPRLQISSSILLQQAEKKVRTMSKKQTISMRDSSKVHIQLSSSKKAALRGVITDETRITLHLISFLPNKNEIPSNSPRVVGENQTSRVLLQVSETMHLLDQVFTTL